MIKSPLLKQKCVISYQVKKIDKITLPHLAEPQQIELLELLDEYSDCFSDTPGFCDVVEHEIITTSDFKPRQCRAYKVPEILKVEIERHQLVLCRVG